MTDEKMIEMVLISDVLPGNCHQAVNMLNKWGVAGFVLAIEMNGRGNTNVILRAENYEQACLIRKRLGLSPMTAQEYRAG